MLHTDIRTYGHTHIVAEWPKYEDASKWAYSTLLDSPWSGRFWYCTTLDFQLRCHKLLIRAVLSDHHWRNTWNTGEQSSSLRQNLHQGDRKPHTIQWIHLCMCTTIMHISRYTVRSAQRHPHSTAVHATYSYPWAKNTQRYKYLCVSTDMHSLSVLKLTTGFHPGKTNKWQTEGLVRTWSKCTWLHICYRSSRVHWKAKRETHLKWCQESRQAVDDN